ncbi:alpha/beta hydrolase [Tessaracoccus terricola]
MWAPDQELESFEVLTLELPDLPTFNGEEPGSLVATIIRRNPPATRRAVLYVHGWSDYFFQRHMADEFADAGYDFYAVDLHRYGRSLRPGQLAGFTTDLAQYHDELNRTADVIAQEGHDELVVVGHSTGGLVAALWLRAHPERAKALVLNSPWLELQGYPALRPAIAPMLNAVGQLNPLAALRVSEVGFYRRSIHASQEGEWDYNENYKGHKAFRVRVGWLAAIMTGHAKVAAGLGIQVPIFMAISERTVIPAKWTEELTKADIVLDVESLASRAPMLGRHVTLVRIQDGLHDLVLSPEAVRAEFFTELRRWLATYG